MDSELLASGLDFIMSSSAFLRKSQLNNKKYSFLKESTLSSQQEQKEILNQECEEAINKLFCHLWEMLLGDYISPYMLRRIIVPQRNKQRLRWDETRWS